MMHKLVMTQPNEPICIANFNKPIYISLFHDIVFMLESTVQPGSNFSRKSGITYHFSPKYKKIIF